MKFKTILKILEYLEKLTAERKPNGIANNEAINVPK
jgi:hypothetical protein